MPNRILREGLIDSDAIGAVSLGAEVLFLRLMLLADDYGCYDGRVSVICRRAYVNRREIDEASTAEWLAELHHAELVSLYEVGGRPYLRVLNFRQRTRAEKSKYPLPPVTNQSLKRSFDCHPSDHGQTDDRPPRTETETETEAYRDNPLTPLQGEVGPVEVVSVLALPEVPEVPEVRSAAVKAKEPPISLKGWLTRCSEAGVKPLPTGCAALAYAERAGISPLALSLHWREFKTRQAETGKRYSDWPKAFLNSLRGNWYGLWLLQTDGLCTLSTKGLQAQRVQAAMQADEGATA